MTDLDLSTSPNLNLVCDVSKNETQLCHVSLIIGVSGFQRTIIQKKMAMQWTVSYSIKLESFVGTDQATGRCSRSRRLFCFRAIPELDTVWPSLVDLNAVRATDYAQFSPFAML